MVPRNPNRFMIIDTQRRELLGSVKSEEPTSKVDQIVERPYLCFNDKTSEDLLKTVLPQLVPSVRLNEGLCSATSQQTQTRTSTVISLSITRKSVDEEINDIRE